MLVAPCCAAQFGLKDPAINVITGPLDERGRLVSRTVDPRTWRGFRMQRQFALSIGNDHDAATLFSG